MDVLRLVLVDDYRMVTEAMASRLSASPDLWVAGCSQTDDPRLPEIIRWLRPDVVLIDVEPLGIAIAEVLGRIREAWPAARIIVVSADTDPGHAVEAARAGADAWVSKNQGADQLDSAISAAAARNGDTFADVRSAFAGHEICDSGSWLHSVTWPLGESYHPSASGQELGYLPQFTAAAG